MKIAKTKHLNIKYLFMRLKCFFALSIIVLGPSSLFAQEMEFVTVGFTGNPVDEMTGRGKVDYEYQVSVYEVTNAQYTEFLNAAAKNHDPYGLYDQDMEDSFWGGIIRREKNGEYQYFSKAGFENRPVINVSWYDAARFINWLHYGKPNSGFSVLGATEGNEEMGAYNTQGAPKRNTKARYKLPSYDEWFKAAFYDPQQKKYWMYATGSDEIPASQAPGDGENSVNYYDNHWAAQAPHIVDVGSYANSPSPFGTYDQNGSVMEWVEDPIDAEGKRRYALGGSFFMYDFSLKRTYFDGEFADQGLSSFGFRVVKTKGAGDDLQLVNKARKEALSKVNRQDENFTAKETLKSSAPLSENLYDQNMVFVRVTHPGNENDNLYGYGSVHYDFFIGKYEITNEQYAQFLNAVAAVSDSYGLYSPSMSEGILGGIIRREADGKFIYKAKDGWQRRPVNYVSWYDLARLANWYHYGRPATGKSEFGTTEGNASEGAYDTRNFATDHRQKVSKAALPKTRNRGARYWLPSQDEWYKAAYFDPTKPGKRKYWDYPVRTSNVPNNLPPPGDQHTVNYNAGGYSAGRPYFLSNVDDYPAAQSYFGTRGQGGNVWEWLESWRDTDKGCWRCDEATRSLRGGSYGYTWLGLHAMNTDPGDPAHEYLVYGGRLARAIDEEGWYPFQAGPLHLAKGYLKRLPAKHLLILGFAAGMLAAGMTSLFAKRGKK